MNTVKVQLHFGHGKLAIEANKFDNTLTLHSLKHRGRIGYRMFDSEFDDLKEGTEVCLSFSNDEDIDTLIGQLNKLKRGT
jgi:hypothetical protein